MKKCLILLLCGALCFVNGCSIYNANPKEAAGNENEHTVTVDGVSVEFQENYYKLRTEPIDIDEDALTRYCLGEDVQYIEQAVESNIFPEEDGRFDLYVDEHDYCWVYSYDPAEYIFLQADEPYIGEPNEKEALEIAKEVISMVDVEFSDEIGISRIEWDIEESTVGDVATQFCFTTIYRDVKFVGNTPLFDSDGGDIPGGTWAYVTIDKDSLQVVSLYNMVRVVEEIETYSPKDFITIEEAVNAAKSECSKMTGYYLMEDPDIEITSAVKEISVIYVPDSAESYEEWIPAYDIILTYTIGDKEENLRAIVDVFTGHVYDWRGAETP